VTADTAAPAGTPLGGQRFDETEVGAATAITLTEVTGAADDGRSGLALPPAGSAGLVDQEWFESLTNQGKRVLLASWQDADAAGAFAAPAGDGMRHRAVRVIRDYGMRDRREAPQYFPDVP
jgi:hypothetical protein